MPLWQPLFLCFLYNKVLRVSERHPCPLPSTLWNWAVLQEYIYLSSDNLYCFVQNCVFQMFCWRTCAIEKYKLVLHYIVIVKHGCLCKMLFVFSRMDGGMDGWFDWGGLRGGLARRVIQCRTATDFSDHHFTWTQVYSWPQTGKMFTPHRKWSFVLPVSIFCVLCSPGSEKSRAFCFIIFILMLSPCLIINAVDLINILHQINPSEKNNRTLPKTQ